MNGNFYFMNDAPRPSGSGQMIGANFIYNAIPQRVDQVAHSIGCTIGHVYHLIDQGAFANVYDISSDTASKPCYRIPRQDVIDYLAAQKVGANA